MVALSLSPTLGDPTPSVPLPIAGRGKRKGAPIYIESELAPPRNGEGLGWGLPGKGVARNGKGPGDGFRNKGQGAGASRGQGQVPHPSEVTLLAQMLSQVVVQQKEST